MFTLFAFRLISLRLKALNFVKMNFGGESCLANGYDSECQ